MKKSELKSIIKTMLVEEGFIDSAKKFGKGVSTKAKMLGGGLKVGDYMLLEVNGEKLMVGTPMFQVIKSEPTKDLIELENHYTGETIEFSYKDFYDRLDRDHPKYMQQLKQSEEEVDHLMYLNDLFEKLNKNNESVDIKISKGDEGIVFGKFNIPHGRWQLMGKESYTPKESSMYRVKSKGDTTFKADKLAYRGGSPIDSLATWPIISVGGIYVSGSTVDNDRILLDLERK
jgi:hypothetical protein